MTKIPPKKTIKRLSKFLLDSLKSQTSQENPVGLNGTFFSPLKALKGSIEYNLNFFKFSKLNDLFLSHKYEKLLFISQIPLIKTSF